jgi:hypothetical protein
MELRNSSWAAGSFAHASAVAPSSRFSLRWLVRNCLMLSFFMSFAQYALSAGPYAVLLAPAGIGICALLVLCGRRRADRVQHILRGGGVMLVALLFTEVVSYTSHDTYSVLYGLLFLGIFLCIRLIVQEIGVANILRAFSLAGLLTVVLILVRGTNSVLHDTSRFNGGVNAHPNLVGYVLAGYLPVLVWRGIEEQIRWRKWTWAALTAAGFVLMFYTASRGSLGAILGALALLVMRGSFTGWLQRFRLTHLHIVLFVLMIPLVVIFLAENNRIGRFGDYLVTFLSLTSSERGINSGLSGRTGIWKFAFHVLAAQNRWLFGFGYRTGEFLVGTIDDGYIEVLFDNGLIAGSLLLSGLIGVFVMVTKHTSFRINNAWNRFYIMLWVLLLVFFLNNISARFLLSFGNPFSLCILMLASTSKSELMGHARSAFATQPVSTPQGQFAFTRAVR